MDNERPPNFGPITKHRFVQRIPKPELADYLQETIEDVAFSEAEVGERLDIWCLNFPDPAFAMYLVVECLDPMSWQEMVDRALACPPRDPRTLPESELHWNHPFRHWELEPEPTGNR